MPKESFTGLQKNTELVFYAKIFLSFFRLTSLVSHHPEFLEIIFYKKNSALFLFSVVNYSQLCSFRPMHTQFRSTLHDLKSFDYVKKQFYCLHRIVVGLKFKLPTRQNKESEKGHIFKILTGKNFKIVCRNEVLLVFKNVQNLFFTPKFLLSFFRLMSLISHHAAFLERLFYKKNSALFLVFCGELFPIVFI